MLRAALGRWRPNRASRGLAVAALLASSFAFADVPRPASKPPAPHAKPRYASYVAKWHAPSPDATAPVDARGRAKLVLVSLNTSDRAELEAAGDAGGFAASDLDRAAFVLREPSSGNEHPVEPRVLDFAYRVQRHFDASEIRVVSGYRTPHRKNASNHGRGRAIDMVVPGVADADVAKFARELGFVGVGIYPSSGFVHVDVRDRSYFWVDASGPGRRDRERSILGPLAQKSDAAATARGESGLPSFAVDGDVGAALARPHSHAASAPARDEDEDEDEVPMQPSLPASPTFHG